MQFKKKTITQADVAKLARVSQSLVSYVVNGNGSVTIPEVTRQRILNAMETLGYVPNVTARRLRSSKTNTIAAIIPDISNPFYPAFARGIQDVVDSHHYDLIMYNTDGDEAKERRCLQSMLQGRVDGLIGVFFHLTAKDLLPLIERGSHVVRLEAIHKEPGEQPLDNISLDNYEAAQFAVKHLIDRGHRRIGMLSSTEGPARFRLLGFQAGMEQHQLARDLVATETFDADGGYRAMQTLLRAASKPSAIFAANDLMAMGAMVAIREAGLSVPGDVAVVGFDNIPTAHLTTPSLTTIDQKQHQMGLRAAEMLFERLTGAAPETGRSERMPYALVVREST